MSFRTIRQSPPRRRLLAIALLALVALFAGRAVVHHLASDLAPAATQAHHAPDAGAETAEITVIGLLYMLLVGGLLLVRAGGGAVRRSTGTPRWSEAALAGYANRRADRPTAAALQRFQT